LAPFKKGQVPDLRKSKLLPRADGPFKVLEKINDNAYKLELRVDVGVSPTFNIADLKPHMGKWMNLSRGRLKSKKRMMRATPTNDTSSSTITQLAG